MWPKKMSGRSRGEYFLSLTDYYAAGGRIEPDGVWLGEGANELGLSGKVKKRELRQLLQRLSPEGNPLTQLPKEGQNWPSGWDGVVSAPKSVSNVWAGRPEYRAAIERAHDEAVRRMLRDAEKLIGRTRRGKGGHEVERAKLVVAAFQHGSSRNLDELLHTHCLIMAVVVRHDGTTAALRPRALYREQRTLAALYRAHLGYLLEIEGFRLERKKDWFEIKGVPETLMKASSTRREEVLEATAAYGGESGKARDVAAHKVRDAKRQPPRAELFPRWEERAEAHGLTFEYARTLVGPPLLRNAEGELEAALDRALLLATAQRAHFTESDLLRFAAEEGQCRGFDPSLLLKAVRFRLADQEKVVKLGRIGEEVRYTTPEMLALEKELLSAASRMHEDRSARPVPERTVERAIAMTEEKETRKARDRDPNAERVQMTAEQRAAVYHVTHGVGRIALVEGLAGTGKTTLLCAVREAFENQGRHVIGTSTAGKAVRGLAEGAGIESYTVARLVGAPEFDYIGDFDRTDDDRARGRRRERVKLDSNTLLIVDEAGTVGTLALARLIREAKETGATLIMVGDSSQLQPVAAAGGPFKSLARRLGSAKLTEITRQVNEWERRAVKQLQEAEAKEALKAYAERGLVWVEGTRDEAIRELVAQWKRSGGVDNPRAHQVFVSTNEERRRVNSLIQDALRSEGRLGNAGVEVKDGEAFSGDRIMFLRRSSYLQVENGDMGTVRAVDPFRGRIEVELDRGGKVTVDLQKYGEKNLTHCFAITVHKGQGDTCDFSYLLTGGGMTDLHSAYVQGSRARLGARYFTDAFEAGDDLRDLARQMSRRREQDLAHDVQDEAAKQSTPPKREHSLELERE
jgi:conjugative relaxase-like TrwC/TraI family protein